MQWDQPEVSLLLTSAKDCGVLTMLSLLMAIMPIGNLTGGPRTCLDLQGKVEGEAGNARDLHDPPGAVSSVDGIMPKEK